MSDALAKAEAAASEAAVNSAAVQVALAAVELARLAQTQQEKPACQHQAPPASQFDAKKWLVIGGVACVCSLAFALASIAIAIGACCATACVLVLRSLFRDIQKGR
ncbi:hypothetical protein GFH48_19025 [Streptomyces fagopyri]|uniref:Uncharacterized protein n=1 Tax=Streptomyces fagopyri TaxID=2662397 RepID=A0A5Q0LDB4_9ACTN|nr:hypothetical protein [Streptomyces fagopyri]QFZ75082.1 hypothetical protein GFH48_19025 [Streptomyces fagopyri]